MKIWKKNLIAAAILVTVCAGIYVNWLYAGDSKTQSLDNTLDSQKVMSDDTLELSEDMSAVMAGTADETTGDSYFASVRLSRQQARDEAINLLQEAASVSGDSKAAESAADLEDIVQTALSEAQIESLIIAKGYADCVAYMTNDGISVAVSAPEGGLQAGCGGDCGRGHVPVRLRPGQHPGGGGPLIPGKTARAPVFAWKPGARAL